MPNVNGHQEATGKHDFGFRDIIGIAGIIALLAFLCCMSVGCAGFMYSNTLTVVNDSSYELTIEINGCPVTAEIERNGRTVEVVRRFRTGGTFTAPIWQDACVLVQAWNGQEYVGSANFSKDGSWNSCNTGPFYARRNYPEAWHVHDNDLNGSSNGGNGIFSGFRVFR
jgi:hypothetical protein